MPVACKKNFNVDQMLLMNIPINKIVLEYMEEYRKDNAWMKMNHVWQ